MNGGVCLRNNAKILRSFTRLFYVSTISNTPSFEEDKIRAKLKPLTGSGGEILLNYGVKTAKDIASITVDNASRKNAFTGLMMVQLAEIIDELETWKSGKGVILHGAEGTFASGGDLSILKAILTPEEGAKMCFFMQRTLTRLRQLPLVSLAVVQGKALGGGAELATACDFRIMHKDAEMRFIHAKLGLSPGWGGGSRLVKLVGRQKALEMLLQCKRMDLEESLKCGLVDAELLESKDVLETAANWLAPYVRDHSSVIRAIKGVVAAADDLPMDEALTVERFFFSTVWGNEAHKSALSKKNKFN